MPINIAKADCCGPTGCNDTEKVPDLTELVQEKYGAVAVSSLSSNDAGVRAVAEAFGYTDAELRSIPAEANMGLSCGNPTATAHLKPGEVVVDLGSGGGLDVFLAARKVGPTGRSIGIDMTPQMIERSRKTAADGGYSNVEFHLSNMDSTPLPDNSVDCIISNCVINLAHDKGAVFREMFRVLKRKGRVAVSDIALKKALPLELAEDAMAFVGCISGAIMIEAYVRGLEGAGFAAVHVVDVGSDLNAYASVDGQSACCSPPMEPKPDSSLTIVAGTCCDAAAPERLSLHQGMAAVLSRYDVNEYAASVKVYAIKM